MDLSRFSLSSLSRLKNRYRNLREYLADVLEGERHFINTGDPNAEPIAPFEVSRDQSRMEKTLSTVRGGSVSSVLETLAPYFDAGFALEGPNVNRISSMFLTGQFFETPRGQSIEVDLRLGGLVGEGVVRGRTEPVLRALRLEGVERLRGCEVFAFSPVKNVIFILFDQRPQVWQVGFLESAYFGVREALEARPGTTAAVSKKSSSARDIAKGIFK